MILAIFASAILPISTSALPQSDLSKRDTIKFCPGMNSQIWDSPSGATTWKLSCDRDTINDGTEHAMVPVSGGTDSFEDCIKVCGNANNNR